jgi:hypothetical protein
MMETTGQNYLSDMDLILYQSSQILVGMTCLIIVQWPRALV